MIIKNVLNFYLLFIILIISSTLSQYSVSGETSDANAPQRLYNNQNVNTRRVSERKCMEYTGKANIDEVISTVNKSTENIENVSEENEMNYPENEEKTDQTNITFYEEEDPNYSVLQIVGGEAAIMNEFPHMVAIGWRNLNGSHSFDCGGTLISPNFVLTAAHCTYSHISDNPIPDVVSLGDNFVEGSVYHLSNPIQVPIKAIHKHPEYTRKKQYNDIALLELEMEVNFGFNIQPACLWSLNDLSYFSTAVATGWGAVDSYSEKRPEKLQKVSLHLLSNEICNSSLENLINKKWDKGFIDSQLCAGEPTGGKDTCQGDSGSPLQVQLSDIYYVIGVTSFGPRICAHLPAVYTRVSSYLDWIESKVWPDDYKNWLNRSRPYHQ